VNSFSANWTSSQETKCKEDHDKSKCVLVGDKNLERLSSLNRIYQIKKWQYVFYKHVILHGLNISVAFPKEQVEALPVSFEWRIFWLCLNSSYVMEFFLQSLVKRGVMSQYSMLTLQWILMISSSLSAIGAVFGRVRLCAFLISLLLNFLNRGHEVVNTMITTLIIGVIDTSDYLVG
jgi:hypothetical protein